MGLSDDVGVETAAHSGRSAHHWLCRITIVWALSHQWSMAGVETHTWVSLPADSPHGRIHKGRCRRRSSLNNSTHEPIDSIEAEAHHTSCMKQETRISVVPERRLASSQAVVESQRGPGKAI